MATDYSTATLPDLIKALTHNMIETGKPTCYMLGQVTSVSPLKIMVDSRIELSENFLQLTHAVRDYKVDITVSHTTENRAGGSGMAEFASHNHDYKGRKTIIIHNGLQVGEMVYLLRQAGGQAFLVVDRVDDPKISGQWGG